MRLFVHDKISSRAFLFIDESALVLCLFIFLLVVDTNGYVIAFLEDFWASVCLRLIRVPNFFFGRLPRGFFFYAFLLSCGVLAKLGSGWLRQEAGPEPWRAHKGCFDRLYRPSSCS